MFHYANGYSELKKDAVVKSGNCYHIAPSSFLKDQDFLAADAVQPIACVDSINEGLGLTVSVSFLDLSESIQPKVDVVTHKFQCGSTTITKLIDSSRYNNFHITGCGENGQVTFKLCNPNGVSSQAFFFDE